MKRYSQKSLACLLLLSLLVSSMTACGEKEHTEKIDDDQSETVLETTPIEVYPSDTYDGNFEGYGFRILAYSNAYKEFLAEELNGDALNDAVYERNFETEEKLNIQITTEYLADAEYNSTFLKNVNAGEDAYDLYQVFMSRAAGQYCPKGYLLDWQEIDYVSENLGKEWWNQGGIKNLKFNGKVFLINGDIGYLTLGNTTGLFFNKAVFDDNGIEYPYASVLDGTWTMDALLELCVGNNRDLNGDGRITVEDDYYAFLSSKWLAPVGLMVGCDLQTLLYDDTGRPVLNFLTEKTINTYEKMYTLLIGNEVNLHNYYEVTMDNDTYRLFTENRAGIIATSIHMAGEFREMDADFGIIPYPKYDAEQENYVSSIDAGTTTSAVAVTAQDTARTGMVIETMAELSYQKITPAYYEVLLKGKSIRDEDSKEMLDIIAASASFDPLYVYNFGDCGFLFVNSLSSKKESIASEYAKLETKAQNAIAEIWDKQ